MLRNSNFCLPSVPFQTAWLAALLYRCFSLRKRSSKGHFGLMAGLVCHKFAGKTGQLIARAARLIEMANLLTVSRIASKILIVLALAVAITMPSIRDCPPHLFTIGEELYSCGDRVYVFDGERSPTRVVQSLLVARPKLARTGLIEMNQDC